MWKENLYRPVEILLTEHDTFPIGKHQHSFYEMAYILNGSGSFSAYFFGERQEEGCEYHTNDLFLIPPDSPHLFTIKEHSKFAFVRFTQNYLTDYVDCKIGESLSLRSGFHIHLSDNDRSAFCHLMKLIVGEKQNKGHLSELLLQHYVNCSILLCTRNLSGILSEYDDPVNNKSQYMLQYIQRHIHQPELLKLDLLAGKFNISPKYAGRFFKRNFGEDYKQYITKNRLKIVEDMLINTKMTVKEIAARLGYTDSCYLSKLFTQHYGVTPSQFRHIHSHMFGMMEE